MEKQVTGWYSYKGTTTLQHENIEEKLTKLFSEVRPSQILEIGTSHGGLTLMIRDILDSLGLQSCEFRSYEVLDTHRVMMEEAIKAGANIDFRLKNLFNQPYSDLSEEGAAEIVPFIQQNGATIVMCDGGSKRNEFNTLSKHIKVGDIIMAHDYSPNDEYFQTHINGKVWNWHEIEDSHIEECTIANNLQPYLQEDFQEVVWVCKKKF